MTVNFYPSHITNKDSIYLDGLDGSDAYIIANPLIDFSGDFYLGIHIDSPAHLDEMILVSKSLGDIADPTQTSFYVKTKLGRMYIYVSDGTAMLCYKTQRNVLWDYRPIQFDIIWRNSAKILELYRNDTSIPLILDTSGGTLADPLLFGSIFPAVGVNLYFGKGVVPPPDTGASYIANELVAAGGSGVFSITKPTLGVLNNLPLVLDLYTAGNVFIESYTLSATTSSMNNIAKPDGTYTYKYTLGASAMSPSFLSFSIVTFVF